MYGFLGALASTFSQSLQPYPNGKNLNCSISSWEHIFDEVDAGSNVEFPLLILLVRIRLGLSLEPQVMYHFANAEGSLEGGTLPCYFGFPADLYHYGHFSLKFKSR